MVNTGDNLAHVDSLPVVLSAFGPLLDVPGVFVFGSNDYYAPTLRNPLWYLLPDNGQRTTHTADGCRSRSCARRSRRAAGWTSTTRPGCSTCSAPGSRSPASTTRTSASTTCAAIPGPAPADADLRVAVAHAPYLRVLDEFAADGYDVTFAGHTHGGQLCLPFVGRAGHELRPARPARAKGLHRHPADSRPGDPGSSWLHVSAGAGTSPYAPVRFCCRPEATLATLTPVS